MGGLGVTDGGGMEGRGDEAAHWGGDGRDGAGLGGNDVEHDERGGAGPDGASLDGLGVTDGGGMEGQRWLDGHDGHDWRGHADDDAASLASINICGELVVRHYCLAGNNSPL